MKYSEIKTMDELERARKQVKVRLDRKGEEVVDSLYGIKETYSPTHLLASGLKSVSEYVPVDQFLLTTIRRIKRKLLK